MALLMHPCSDYPPGTRHVRVAIVRNVGTVPVKLLEEKIIEVQYEVKPKGI